MKVYFDHAATTPLDESVLESMLPYLKNSFGNPSSTHSYGREAKTAIEKARKSIAKNLGIASTRIVFTSGATEANNLALHSAITQENVKAIICSPIEHPAVLNTVKSLSKQYRLPLEFLNLSEEGVLQTDHLEELLSKHGKSVVSAMHANNEIGNFNPITEIRELSSEFGALLHCDTVQTVGLGYTSEIDPDFYVGSAHKFNGPKGVGFLIFKEHLNLDPIIHGGGQERGYRSGTENVAGIVGLAKSLDLAIQNRADNINHLKGLKNYFIQQISTQLPSIQFNGLCQENESSLPGIVNFSIPGDANPMVLFNLDINGIAVSGGSACSSGALQGSHVLNALNPDAQELAIRVSFGKTNTSEEIDYFVSELLKAI